MGRVEPVPKHVQLIQESYVNTRTIFVLISLFFKILVNVVTIGWVFVWAFSFTETARSQIWHSSITASKFAYNNEMGREEGSRWP